MLKIFILICLLAALAATAGAKQIFIEIDGAQFRYSEKRTLWEMYYSFPDTSLVYKEAGEFFSGDLVFKITFSDAVKQLYSEEWTVTNTVEAAPDSFRINVTGIKSFMLPPGQYKVHLLVVDKNDTSTFAAQDFDLIIRDFSKKESMELSDIELASKLEDTDNREMLSGPFGKSRYYVVPNPTLEYSGKEPVFKAYFEIYNAVSASPDGFSAEYTIYDGVKRQVFRYEKERKSIADAMIETPVIPLPFLPTGVYFFRASVSYGEDEEKKNYASQYKKFFLLNPNVPPALQTGYTENQSYEASYWATLSEEEVDTEFKKAEPLAIALEMEQYEMIESLEAKRKYMYRFWKMRDPDTTTAVNEKLEEHRKLIKYANTFFSYGKMKDGWKTDRGRVLLKYGEPTQVETHPRDKDMRAYEIWFYDHIQGGIRFYFVDYTGFNNYIQVHSDAIGQPRNYNWYEQYVPMYGREYEMEYQQNR